MDKSLEERKKLSIKVIKDNDQYTIGRLAEIDKDAFGDGGIDEWVMLPLMRHGRIIALYYNNELIGDAQFMKDWDNIHKAYLYGVAISPKYRGMGFGTWFLDACFEELKKEGIKTIDLTVDPENHGAIKVYK